MSDYIPSNDGQYRDWLANFLNVLDSHLAQVGLVEADTTVLKNANVIYAEDVTDHAAKQAAAIAATGKKRNSRALTEAYLRPLVQRISHHPGMTPELRGLLKLPVKSSGRAVVTAVGIAVKPALFLETEPGTVYVHFGTDPANERLNSKPAGVKACNIYRKKAGEENYQLLASPTSSPFVDQVTGPAADYTYVARYRGTKMSDLGPESTAATIAARGEVAIAA